MYTPADDDDPSSDPTKYAFHMEPQLEKRGESWIAFYPGADWSVSAPDRQLTLQRLGEEFIRRQNSGEDPLA